MKHHFALTKSTKEQNQPVLIREIGVCSNQVGMLAGSFLEAVGQHLKKIEYTTPLLAMQTK